ncbi:response regulator transcription factor [Microvirga sp. STS02]|uniref:LytR/AlgR family response regulator transcription factor n=1 Tax=Hymenobacter negativus TaxID=2795026 RepID=UPI0018DBE8E6|nr:MULTISPECIES: LytTR family DNA-binding domain-containing protein [Bacteria]MBH8568588.1 response regulator transcription factor [Hymenobacter negativus]MBR7208322.1 response regulator transcription factor [Microvirga sp. STS02]
MPAPESVTPATAAPFVINCVAVDDEPLALGLVCSLIEQTPFLRLVGRHESAVAALRSLHERPDAQLLFLDIKMPDLSGLELAKVLQHGPRVIFTTAFNQYALEGFRVDALDYLLKPFDYQEFLRAALKAKTYFEMKQASEMPAPTTTTPPIHLPANPPQPEEDHIYLKVEYQLVRVPLADIVYVEGLKDYVKVHLATQTRPLLSLTSLRGMEEKLPASKFLRIHRSYIVGLGHIQSVGRGTVQIAGETLPVSDGYREAFDQFFSRWK